MVACERLLPVLTPLCECHHIFFLWFGRMSSLVRLSVSINAHWNATNALFDWSHNAEIIHRLSADLTNVHLLISSRSRTN